ncbi:MAG: cysteine--tRNA ligase [Mariprofundales bacterium]|nr:cysteine--tRNA ligase [Mariprofundales bacterium]
MPKKHCWSSSSTNNAMTHPAQPTSKQNIASLRIYNSLSRQKELFAPRKPGAVGIYLCGVTVYDYCHIGHARVMVAFDHIYRWFRQLGFTTNFVRNFTDIDDKIIARAHENNEPIHALTARMIDAFHADTDALGCLRPDAEPCATAHMTEIITMIKALLASGHGYISTSGDLLYAVRSFEDYGRLSGKNLDDLKSGSRVEIDTSKRDPLDFVLWKMGKPGEPAWDSPWGSGRPGWHIECSAMSCAHLGTSFDIHGGGMDLRFPHHENEIAQARAANGGAFARYWLHNGFVNINNEKMSKSLGNFFTIREVTARYHPEIVRMFITATHYRSPLEFSDQALDSAKAALDRLYATRQRLDAVVAGALPAAFAKAMNDDFNTPEALAVLFESARELNRRLDRKVENEGLTTLAAQFVAMCDQLGLVQQDTRTWFHGEATSNSNDNASEIEALITRRNQARQARDFAAADAVRAELDAMGITLKDTLDGTTWMR